MLPLDNFWTLIELSWSDSPELDNLRQQALQPANRHLLDECGNALSGPILDNYDRRLKQLSQQDLTDFIHTLEERLYHIDRQDVHEYTEGSDDGFLYARCYILGMGRPYYDMVDRDPSRAVADLWAEPFGFHAYQLYEERFGEEFDRGTEHDIETCSNFEGWPSEA